MNESRFPIQKPWLTEKSVAFTSEGKYVFIVRPDATKPEIRKAIQRLYSVHVTNVNVIYLPAKNKRSGAVRSMRGGHKKAIVTLKKGEVIELAK